MLEVQKEGKCRICWNRKLVVLEVIPVDVELARDLALQGDSFSRIKLSLVDRPNLLNMVVLDNT